jgi:hypothetical protein
MKLNNRYFHPFDRTYAAVTRGIEREAEQLPSPKRLWLERLVFTFQQERSHWNERPELLAYRLRWMTFRTKLMRLVAGAYLHIGYDLPRALADDWPGQGNWSQGPTKDDGQAIYFKIGQIFPENLVRSARDIRTIGLAALVLRAASEKALSSAGIWVDALRKGAWLHAEILHNAPDRLHREAKMAEAMTAALQDAFLIYPWSILRLLPPDGALYSFSVAAVAMFLFEMLNAGGSYVLVALISGFVWSRLVYARFRLRVDGDMIYYWGFLTNDYVSAAVRDPEGFNDYLVRRRTGLRQPPEAESSSA